MPLLRVRDRHVSQTVRIEDEPTIANAAVDQLILDASCVVTQGLFTPRTSRGKRSGDPISASRHLIRGVSLAPLGGVRCHRLNTRQYREPESLGAFCRIEGMGHARSESRKDNHLARMAAPKV